jgi:hypothetical protein
MPFTYLDPRLSRRPAKLLLGLVLVLAGCATSSPTAMRSEAPATPSRVCDTGPVPTPLGNETICLWRTGTALMAAGGMLGAPDQLFAIAADMDARATRSR